MLIDGKKIAEEIQLELKESIVNSGQRKPCLAVILVGEHPASLIYIARKTQACEKVGIKSIKLQLPENTSEAALMHEIQKLNQDPTVDGILVQLPLPKQINPTHATLAISPEKDVDGFHPMNMGKLLIGESDGFIPCTPLGIKVLLERSNIEVAGKNALIIGRSTIVGKPMAALLMQGKTWGNATVTVAHSHTKNLKELAQNADILIAAIGRPHLITKDMVKEGAAVIDVGINKIDNPKVKSGYRIVGDVDFESVKSKCSHITPVPGGVGPITIAMLLSNTILSYKRKFPVS